ncbi:ABC transporter substrate-binding protein [Leifsonia shinshuensis]|uniref:sn-glycerol 3-phosphate transport system substrate-binding protein n=1 Tax=Leifsonia shinshuensis TaxID=150026 RepID=A0A853CNT9_9MICO|nr:ABC transporter substrate-binding protein [Leifsonia shinshuensis]NYJ22526.1 sn-glycerol 3-phosphate transport system substrate-binding protein [Leifsonia shinshuensis]
MKRSVALGAAALLLLSLAGCSAGADSPATSASDAPGPSALANAKGVTEISFWHGLGGINAQALQSLIDEFNTENAGKIKVDTSAQGSYADLLAKYTASLRDKSTPTVTLSNDISSGFLHDVKRSVSPEAMAAANPGDLKLDQLAPAGKRYYSVNDELVAVPMNMSTPLLFVNTELLQQAGVETSSLKTLDGLAAAATKITQATGVPGIAEAFDDWWFEQLTATSGNLYCTPENGRGTKSADKVSFQQASQVKAFSTMADLYKADAGLDVGTDNNNAVTAFAAGKTAMMFNSSATAASVANSTTFPYGALPFPLSAPSSKAGTVVGGSAMWLSNQATPAQQVAGWKLISFLASPASQAKFSEATGYVPANTALENTTARKDYLASHPVAQVAIDQVKDVADVPASHGCFTGAFSAIRAAMVPQMQAAFSGSKTMKQALADATTAANQAISDYKEQLAGD